MKRQGRQKMVLLREFASGRAESKCYMRYEHGGGIKNSVADNHPISPSGVTPTGSNNACPSLKARRKTAGSVGHQGLRPHRLRRFSRKGHSFGAWPFGFFRTADHAQIPVSAAPLALCVPICRQRGIG